MIENNGFLMFQPDEAESFLVGHMPKRKIRLVQLHHTWSPEYKHFDGRNHFTRQAAMRQSHLARGFNDIAQHFTVFPDGMIVTGRSLEKDPAGIVGANSGAICIENFGNFDTGWDVMTTEQSEAIETLTAALCKVFGLNPETAITYHAWWTAKGQALGDYHPAKSAKTCPGTAFFGGNTRDAFLKNLLPRIKDAMQLKEETEMRYKYYDDMPDWAKPTIAKLVRKGLLKGDCDGAHNLSEDALKVFVVNDRAGLYGE